jgi:hypothetical protein
VPNTLLSNGCTISDRIRQCASGARNHGAFVSCVAHLTKQLVRSGAITGIQKDAIMSCAGSSRLP